MEENTKRIRVVFRDDDILSETQKSDGLNRSWVLLKSHQNGTVSDVASHLLHAFHLHQSCPHGLLLSISGFVLPPFESTTILKDNEIIRVSKRREVLSIEGNNDDANEVKKLKAVEKQPVNTTDVLLLANEEFEKEQGGYESDDPDEEFEEDPKKKRKRKAAEKIEGSKRKKQRSEATETVENNASNKKKRSRKEKRDVSNDEDNVEDSEKMAELIDKGDVSVPDIKGNDEVQENGKETEDAEMAPKETKKGPSRSARRKYAKRKWLKEMAKIQKQNETCESEGLRNWKEDQAKSGKKKVDGQFKVQQKWKKHQADAEREEEDDGQPKGLLHLKISPENNQLVKRKRHQERNKRDHFQKRPNQNGDMHEKVNQNGDEHEHPTPNVDGSEQTNKKQGDVQELPNENCDASKQLNEESGDEETEVFPVVIRPGHIRFEPLGKEQAVQQTDVPSETYQWNGITSKKKGQQWGKESRSFTPRNDYKLPNKEPTQILNNEKEKQPDKVTNFDKLPPLPSTPKEGDVIAYRLLELSSSWTPELSDHRVGKVSSYNAETNQTMLVPVPEYPIVPKMSDEEEDVQPDNSLYKEDGSLEIDFSLLIDVRIVNNGTSGQGNESLSLASEDSIHNEIAPMIIDKQTDTSDLNKGKETQPATAETVGTSIWDEVSEALNTKKEQLAKANGWGVTPKKVQPSQDNSWGNNAKKVQPSPENSWGKTVSKVQPSQDNSRDKQNSGGGKPWSYKGLRGGGLASTMAMLRSKKDVWG